MEQQYLNLIKEVLKQPIRNGRNGAVYSDFGPQHIFNLNKGFPLLTTKKMNFKAIVEELLFFLKGHTQTKELENKGIKIWSGNTSAEFLKNRGLNYPEGEMGPMYGYNWRYFSRSFLQSKNEGVDQLKNLIEGLINDPYSRRHLLTTYDPSTVNEGVLAPCHGIVTQFYVSSSLSPSSLLLQAKESVKEETKKELHCKMYQRSADLALGYPFNIASYALLLKIIAAVCGYKPGNLIITLGDVHIYEEHTENLRVQLLREPMLFPQLKINKTTLPKCNDIEKKIKWIESLTFEDFNLINYKCHTFIKFLMKA